MHTVTFPVALSVDGVFPLFSPSAKSVPWGVRGSLLLSSGPYDHVIALHTLALHSKITFKDIFVPNAF